MVLEQSEKRISFEQFLVKSKFYNHYYFFYFYSKIFYGGGSTQSMSKMNKSRD